jgi:hypothetical protein
MTSGPIKCPRRKEPRGGTEQDELSAALARAKAAQAEAAEAKAEAVVRATEEAVRAKAEAARDRIRAENAYADSRVPGTSLAAFGRPIDFALRKRLVATLGMLGSQRDHERASAALIAEKERLKLGMTWDELIARVQTDDVDDLVLEDEDLEDDDLDDDFDDVNIDDEEEDDEYLADEDEDDDEESVV